MRPAPALTEQAIRSTLERIAELLETDTVDPRTEIHSHPEQVGRLCSLS
jgi:hypothetical protein